MQSSVGARCRIARFLMPLRRGSACEFEITRRSLAIGRIAEFWRNRATSRCGMGVAIGVLLCLEPFTPFSCFSLAQLAPSYRLATRLPGSWIASAMPREAPEPRVPAARTRIRARPITLTRATATVTTLAARCSSFTRSRRRGGVQLQRSNPTVPTTPLDFHDTPTRLPTPVQ